MPHAIDELNTNQSSTTTTNNSSSNNITLRQKLRNSLTYLIYTGCFESALKLIESSKPKHLNNTNLYHLTNFNNKNGQTTAKKDLSSNRKEIENFKSILNETDEWWTNNPNLFIYGQDLKRKIILTRLNTELRMSTTNRSDSADHTTLNSQRAQSSTTSSLRDKLISTKGKTIARTSLMLCCLVEDKNWSFSLAQTLIENGASLSLKDSNGYNAIMYACLYEREDLLDLFLKAPGDFNLFARDFFGNTAFHLASLNKSEKNCSLLHKLAIKLNLEQTKLALNKNNFSHTSFDLCRMNGHDNCVKFNYSNIGNSINNNNNNNNISANGNNQNINLRMSLSSRKSTASSVSTTILHQSLPNKFNLIPMFTLNESEQYYKLNLHTPNQQYDNKLRKSFNETEINNTTTNNINNNESNINDATSSYCYFDKSFNLNKSITDMASSAVKTPNTVAHNYFNSASKQQDSFFLRGSATPNPTSRGGVNLMSSYAKFVYVMKEPLIKKKKQTDNLAKNAYLKITQENVYRTVVNTASQQSVAAPSTPAPTPTPAIINPDSNNSNQKKLNREKTNINKCLVTRTIKLPIHQDIEFLKEFNSNSTNIMKQISTSVISSVENKRIDETERESSFFQSPKPLNTPNTSSNNNNNNLNTNNKNNVEKINNEMISNSWRDDMQNLFEQIEFQKTNSFRKPITNINQSSLFEQISKGILLRMPSSNIDPLLSSHGRRNSIVNSNNHFKNSSSISSNSTSRRQSIVSSNVNSAIMIGTPNNRKQSMVFICFFF